MPKKEKVREMFDSISGDYDKLNHIMSLDVDRTWRKRALKRIVDTAGPLSVLDLACGTGDFSVAVAERLEAGHVTGVDLSEGMLKVMEEKVARKGLGSKVSAELGDGEDLHFSDASFDRVTIAFGIRNFEDKAKGLREALRVLKPGGRLVILELSRPENAVVRWLYDLYFLHVMPTIGGSVSGDKAAYRYLPASVVNFPSKDAFMAMMMEAGFGNVRHEAFTFGICRMFIGEKV